MLRHLRRSASAACCPPALAVDTASGHRRERRPESRARRWTCAPPGGTSTAPRRPSAARCPTSPARAGVHLHDHRRRRRLRHGRRRRDGCAPAPTATRSRSSIPPARPATHWDASAVESILPDTQGQQKQWAAARRATASPTCRAPALLPLHRDAAAPRRDRRLQRPTQYCPASPDHARADGGVRAGGEGRARDTSRPPAPTPVFADVPATQPLLPLDRGAGAARRGRRLRRRQLLPGAAPVTREQMAVFVLRTLDPALNPPACAPPIYNDVPATQPVLPLDRGAGAARRGQRLRRRQLLPDGAGHPRADGRLHQRDVRPDAVRGLISSTR